MLSGEAAEVGPEASEQKGLLAGAVALNELNDVTPEVPNTGDDVDEPNKEDIVGGLVVFPDCGRRGFALPVEPPTVLKREP